MRLTELVPDLLDKVDVKKLAFNPGVELSYLTRTEQAVVVGEMAKYEIKPSLSQSVRLKKLSQAKELTVDGVDSILSANKKAAKSNRQGVTRFRQYFPPEYTEEQIEAVVVDLLTKWKARGAV